MRKLILFLLIVLACTLPPPVDAQGLGPMGPGPGVKGYAAGPACSSGTADVTQSDGSSTGSVTTDARGQGFVPATNGSYLYSIKIYIGASPARNVTMRWGTSTDLTSGYYGEAVVNVGAAGWYEFVFADTTHQLSTSTTYYYGFVSAGTTTTYYYNNTNAYAGGAWRSASGGGVWNMGTTGAYDMLFEIDKCAD